MHDWSPTRGGLPCTVIGSDVYDVKSALGRAGVRGTVGSFVNPRVAV